MGPLYSFSYELHTVARLLIGTCGECYSVAQTEPSAQKNKSEDQELVFPDVFALDGFETRCIHAGQTPDLSSGAVITPISLATTFVQVGSITFRHNVRMFLAEIISSFEWKDRSIHGQVHFYLCQPVPMYIQTTLSHLWCSSSYRFSSCCALFEKRVVLDV